MPTAMASSVAGINWMPRLTLKIHAATAPRVTSSPCAKFVRPVVPKIRLNPTPAIAITRPNRSPSTTVRITVSHPEVPNPERDSPNEKMTVSARPAPTSRWTVACTLTSAGRDCSSTSSV